MLKQLARIGAPGEFTPEEIASYVEVEDRGADVTVFAYTGLAALFAGLPAFEFRSLLRGSGLDFNIVCFRDIRRYSYHLTPEGQPGGLDFYEEKTRELMKSLGATHNIALGASGGGSAAIYFGTRCGMDQAIGFSPSYPALEYAAFKHRCRAYFDVPRFLRSSKEYIELLLVTITARKVFRGIVRDLGREAYWKVFEEYEAADERPSLKIAFGERNPPDSRIAKRFGALDGVDLLPLDTGLHGVAGFLKREGRLGPFIVDTIKAGVEKSGAELSRGDDK